MKSDPTKKSLRDQLRGLREKLDEKEQTIEAIRSGKVDALIVEGEAGPRVFTLRGADHRYRRIVEGMKEGAAIVSPEGTILYGNVSFAKLLSAPIDRILGASLLQYVPHVAFAAMGKLLLDAQNGNATVDTTLIDDTNNSIPVHVSAVTDADMPGAVCLIITDLSEPLRDAEAMKRDLTARLAEKSRLLEAALTHMPAALVAVDRSGEVTVANRRAKEVWDGALERPDWPVEKTLAGQEIRGVEIERRANDGTPTYLSLSASPLRNDSGDIVGAVAVADDVTERKALHEDAKRAYEAERAARDRAEAATRLKDEFLATLSHELRTPLSSILGWARLLQSNAVPDEKKQHAIDTIVRNALAQSQLIEDLLDVSRITSGKLRIDVSPIDFNRVIEAAIDVVRPAADARGVTLKVALDKALHVIDGDSARLQQIVWNLLTNAVKFTPRGGQVLVALDREGASAKLTVKDTGAGIASEFLPHVFDRFRQQDGSTTRSAGGLGLGLAIVKSLVELHGGTVEAHSDGVSRGATFVVRFPSAPLRSAPPPPAPDEARAVESVHDEQLAPVEGLRVLVVDDEPDARDLTRALLERCGAVVTTASSVAEALAAVDRTKPDVIVSDIGMPAEDGYSFIRKIRALPFDRGGRTPAIALTAYARPEDRTRALVAGFQSYATKPIDSHELLVVVASLAGRFS